MSYVRHVSASYGGNETDHHALLSFKSMITHDPNKVLTWKAAQMSDCITDAFARLRRLVVSSCSKPQLPL
ncbi:leucine-rich repeat protein, partial [Tanacetum coccineum]